MIWPWKLPLPVHLDVMLRNYHMCISQFFISHYLPPFHPSNLIIDQGSPRKKSNSKACGAIFMLLATFSWSENSMNYASRSFGTSDAGSQYRCGWAGRGFQPPSLLSHIRFETRMILPCGFCIFAEFMSIQTKNYQVENLSQGAFWKKLKIQDF